MNEQVDRFGKLENELECAENSLLENILQEDLVLAIAANVSNKEWQE